jgi:hypothetical protein
MTALTAACNAVPTASAEPLRHHRPANSSLPKVRLDLWWADAVVLFDWLKSVDLNAVPVSHPAEKQALADLLTRLEH